MKEYQIDEIFFLNGAKYKVIEDNELNCENCGFKDVICWHSKINSCISQFRKDEKNVCFKLINRGGLSERKIGDIIEYDGNKLKVIEGTCEDCCFNDKPNEFCYALFYMLGSCTPMLRKKTKKPKSICYQFIKDA